MQCRHRVRVGPSAAARRRGAPPPSASVRAGIDLCNHQFGDAANCEIRPTPGGVRLAARRPLAPGEECCIDYGALPNDFLLMDYVRARARCRAAPPRHRARSSRRRSPRPAGASEA